MLKSLLTSGVKNLEVLMANRFLSLAFLLWMKRLEFIALGFRSRMKTGIMYQLDHLYLNECHRLKVSSLKLKFRVKLEMNTTFERSATATDDMPNLLTYNQEEKI